MLRQVCRRARLLASMKAATALSEVAAILEDVSPSSVSESSKTSASRPEKMPVEVYDLILQRVQQGSPHTRDHRNLPHPPGAEVLSPYAHSISHLTQASERVYAKHTAHAGNSAILFRSASGAATPGFIESIWTLHESTPRTFIITRPHGQLSQADQSKDPYQTQPKLCAQVVYAATTESCVVIESSDIIAHTAYRVRPANTFGIRKQTMIVVNLDRGRSDIVY
jgi:hypothetical protein